MLGKIVRIGFHMFLDIDGDPYRYLSTHKANLQYITVFKNVGLCAYAQVQLKPYYNGHEKPKH